jgi:hypothetical protein
VTTHPSERLLVVGVVSRTRSPIFDGGNMGIGRRQLHTMFKQSNYDPFAASGAT